MQMPLNFEEAAPNEAQDKAPSANVWPMLDAERRSEARTLLARLLAKAAATSQSDKPRRGVRDD